MADEKKKTFVTTADVRANKKEQMKKDLKARSLKKADAEKKDK